MGFFTYDNWNFLTSQIFYLALWQKRRDGDFNFSSLCQLLEQTNFTLEQLSLLSAWEHRESSLGVLVI